METINFRIIKESEQMCRIETGDIRTKYKKIADGACICSLDVMLDEMVNISNKVKELGSRAVFTIESNKQ